MRKSEYVRLRAKLESEEALALAAAEQTRRKIDALDLVWNEVLPDAAAQQLVADDKKELQPSPATEPHVASNGNSPVQQKNLPSSWHTSSIKEMVEIAVKQMNDEFGVREIITWAAKTHGVDPKDINRSTVSGMLRRMVTDKSLIQVSEGRGRAQSYYRRPVMALTA